MEYDGIVIGPRLRELRKNRKLTLDKASELTGLSVSTLKQIEQGGRRLSMASLYLLMTAYQCDANTVLNISNVPKDAFEMEWSRLSDTEKEKCKEVFGQIIRMILAVDGGRKNE